MDTSVLVTTSVNTALSARGFARTRAASVAALGSGATGKPSLSWGHGGCLVAITLTRSVGGLPLRHRTRTWPAGRSERIPCRWSASTPVSWAPAPA
ncbi:MULTISPECIES: hypothetical protein [Actinosynnema]|uniref:hypothetical protein n=1 Tax=Actinosynnema TaxID=40566 RepID=UPI0020A5BEB2|nr:hypothetical protein [Actinosynnema pretiosum]